MESMGGVDRRGRGGEPWSVILGEIGREEERRKRRVDVYFLWGPGSFLECLAKVVRVVKG